MKEISNLESLKEYFRENIDNPIFGVGVSAFNRIGLAEVVENYKLLSLKYSLDTELIEKDIELYSLEKELGESILKEPKNSTTVLKNDKSKKFINQFPGKPLVLPFNSSRKMEAVCKENNWIQATNPIGFGKELFEDKIKFRNILENTGIDVIPGEINKFKKLDYQKTKSKYNLPFVLQHPRSSGGKGTFFIKNRTDWDNALEKIQNPTKYNITKDKKSKNINKLELLITKFITGPSPATNCCVTRFGVLILKPRLQIMNTPLLCNPEVGSGVFCGNDWSASKFSEKVKSQVYIMGEKIGKIFKNMGYKGIFGIDFILDEKKEKIYLVEANPRLTGNFPTTTLIQLANNEPPLIVFHVLEFLNAKYELDIDKINKIIQKDKFGAQVFIRNLENKSVRTLKQIKAGVYDYSHGKLKYKRPGYDFSHFNKKDEFIITENVPFKDTIIGPYMRICRLLFNDRILKNSTDLNSKTEEIVKKTYDLFF